MVSEPPPAPCPRPPVQRRLRLRPDRRLAVALPASPASASRKASRYTKTKSHTTSGSSYTTSPRIRPALAARCPKLPRLQEHRLVAVLPAALLEDNRRGHNLEHSPALSPELPAQTACLRLTVVRCPLHPRRPSLRSDWSPVEAQRVVAILHDARPMQRAVVFIQRESHGMLDDRQSRRPSGILVPFERIQRGPILVLSRIRRVNKNDIRVQSGEVYGGGSLNDPRSGLYSQRGQIAPDQVHRGAVLLDEDGMPSAPAQSFDPDRAGAGVCIHEHRAFNLPMKDTEQRFADLVRRWAHFQARHRLQPSRPKLAANHAHMALLFNLPAPDRSVSASGS